MCPLHNRVDKRLLKQRILNDTTPRTTLSFYRYVIIQDIEILRNELYRMWDKLGCLGRIYIAREGINAQMTVPTSQMNQFKEELYTIPYFKDVPFKIAVEENGKSFFKLVIKIKQKIVADGLNDDAFDVTNVGKHLTAKEFNEALENPDTIVVDMRNHYESEIGKFKNAICPDVDTFKEELPLVAEMLKEKKEKKLLLYCTGGIRCEKASAYFKHLGFEDVNQLHGGIIDYVRQVKNEGLENKFLGRNFVFDERMAERISEDIIANCHQCGKPFDLHTNCKNVACNLLFIQCPDCQEKMNNCCSEDCMNIVALPEDAQKELRKGHQKEYSKMLFKKGRYNKL